MTTENPQRESLLAWYEIHVPAMPLATAKKHMLDLERDLQNVEGTSLRLEFEAALKLVTKRVDELLPKVPASVSQHDHSIGDRVKLNWPDHLQASTMYVHMHLCELLYAWNINPNRSAVGEVTVDEYAETIGMTRFVFSSDADADDFINQYGIVDFMVSEQSYRSDDNEDAWSVTFTNRFERDEVNAFLQTYNRAITNLSVIYDERRRAVSMDDGKFGFVTADHFTQREAIELARITSARELLGRGYKNLNKS